MSRSLYYLHFLDQITQDSKGVDVQEYEEMQTSKELLLDIQKSVSDIKEGKGIEHFEAKKLVLSMLCS